MKKPDMLKEMCDYFYEANKEIFDDPDKRLNMLDVGVTMVGLLERMEKLGMKPPQLPNVSSYDLAMGGDYNRWEPEEEIDNKTLEVFKETQKIAKYLTENNNE